MSYMMLYLKDIIDVDKKMQLGIPLDTLHDWKSS